MGGSDDVESADQGTTANERSVVKRATCQQNSPTSAKSPRRILDLRTSELLVSDFPQVSPLAKENELSDDRVLGTSRKAPPRSSAADTSGRIVRRFSSSISTGRCFSGCITIFLSESS